LISGGSSYAPTGSAKEEHYVNPYIAIYRENENDVIFNDYEFSNDCFFRETDTERVELSNSNVLQNTEVNIKAKDEILIKDGFNSFRGSTFNAKIVDE